jgi:nucleoside phosphorylase
VALFIGVAGGLKEDVKLGDVVVANKIYGYGSGKATTTFQTRPEVGISTYLLVKRAEAEARKADWLHRLEKPLPTPVPGAFIAPIAAGEQVVASTHSALYKFLRIHYNDALAVEMEGYGFLKVVQANSQLDALVIRGISDLIDGKSESDKAHSQEIAARHACAFAFEMLAKLGEDKAFRSHHDKTSTTIKSKRSMRTTQRSDKYNIHFEGNVQSPFIGDNHQVTINYGDRSSEG